MGANSVLRAVLLNLQTRLSFDQSDLARSEESALFLLESSLEPGAKASALFLAVRTLCCSRKYERASDLVQAHSKDLSSETCFGLAQTLLFLRDEKLDFAESAVPSAADVEDLVSLDERLDGTVIRLELWIEYGFYDKVSSELRALQRLSELPDLPLRFTHKVQAHIIAAALFLRDFDVIRACPLVKEYDVLPSTACNEIARIVLPQWAGMVTLTHEYLPMIRNFHYGFMPMVFRGLQLLVGKKERNLTPRLLLNLSRVCSAMFCFDWVVDDQADRTSFEPYMAYLDGYLELRDTLYLVRERMRKVWDISDSHDDLQGTGWILISIAQTLAVSPCEHGRVLLGKAYYRCLWRQGDKCDLILSRQREALPTRMLQMELYFLRAFRFYVSEKWEAFLYHHEQALAFWESFSVNRASSLCRHSRLLPVHRTLSMLMCAYHMHHTLEHHKAVSAMEKYRIIFIRCVFCSSFFFKGIDACFWTLIPITIRIAHLIISPLKRRSCTLQ